MKQRDAVYNAVVSVLGDANISFEDGQDASALLTKELRARVQSVVVEGFTSGTIAFEQSPANEAKLADLAKLNSYVSGLISNWLRKDRRLNGNIAYVAKNPGSRAGQGDEQLKTLRALHRQFVNVDPDKASAVQGHIDARIAELREQNAKSVSVDTSSLSPELVAALGLNN